MMKLTLQHFAIKSTHAMDTWVRNQISALQPRLQIDAATVRLAYHHEVSPAYHVRVHLVTPGPDVFAESRDHTLRAAITKAMTQLHSKIARRATKRLQNVKSNLSTPSSKARRARAASI